MAELDEALDGNPVGLPAADAAPDADGAFVGVCDGLAELDEADELDEPEELPHPATNKAAAAVTAITGRAGRSAASMIDKLTDGRVPRESKTASSLSGD